MEENSILSSLNGVQKNAVVDTEGQLLVLAGAGSGKTRVLTSRVAYLVKEKNVAPYNILAITFTNKAAAEMKSRISQMLGGNADVWISTFHSMCAQILFRECKHIGYDSNFSIYSEAESSRVVKRILKMRENNGEEGASKLFDKYYYHIKYIKGFNCDPEEYIKELKGNINKNDLLNVYHNYERNLKTSNSMDFDDLLLKTGELFRTCPEILEKYKNRFKYIHVDEFQDTNKIQYELVCMLAGKNGNLFVVGDEDQSIYGWRGAVISNILNFKKNFPNAKIYKMEENYRSTSYILNAANRVISNNSQRLGKNLFTSKKGGKRIEIFNAYNDKEEVNFAVRNISDLVRLAGYNYGDIAILMRANSLTRQYEEAFNWYGIPYRVYGGIKFYERREIKDFLAYLRIAVNPKDTDSIIRVINIPKRAIGNVTVEKLVNYAKMNNLELFEVILNIESNPDLNAGTIKKIAKFRDIFVKLMNAVKEMRAVDFVEFAFKESGLEDFYKGNDAEVERFENIKEFISAVADYQKENENGTIVEFMRMVALISDIDNMDESNVVTLATIHSVKGLEFPIVFIVALEEGIFPSNRAINDGEIEEERRLMYVAITRAKERLYCSSSRSRFRFNQYQNNSRSRFIAEMVGKTPVIKSDNRDNVVKEIPKNYNNKITPSNKNTLNPAEYVAGKHVLHKKFGEGIIISTNGEGNEKIATISFKGIGIKKFVIAIANMKVIK